MALKIIKANESIKVDHICVTIYKLPGIGGTSLAFTAGKVLLFDTDDGSYRSGNRGDTVRPKSWSEIANLTAEDVAAYDVIALDTVGRALDMLTIHLLGQDPKLGRKSGDLSLQGFGALKTAFITWKNKMLSFGKDVIFCSHMDEKQEGDIIKERFDIQGGSRAEIYKSSDAIAKLYIEGKSRKLDFSPREGSLGKNPAQFDILTVPNFATEPHYFAGVMADIKNALNRLSDSQKQHLEDVDRYRTLIMACQNAADFNAILPAIKDADAAVKMLAMAEATKKGVAFDRQIRQFFDTAASRPPQQPQPAPSPRSSQEGAFPPPDGASPATRQPEDGSPLPVWRVHVADVELKNHKDRLGQWILLTCDVEGEEEKAQLRYFHKTDFDALKNSLGKDCEFEVERHENKNGDVNYTIEKVLQIGLDI